MWFKKYNPQSYDQCWRHGRFSPRDKEAMWKAWFSVNMSDTSLLLCALQEAGRENSIDTQHNTSTHIPLNGEHFFFNFLCALYLTVAANSSISSKGLNWYVPDVSCRAPVVKVTGERNYVIICLLTMFFFLTKYQQPLYHGTSKDLCIWSDSLGSNLDYTNFCLVEFE